MSKIKVNKIENTSTTDGGISIDNSGHVTVDGQKLPSAGPLSNRNLVINGAMKVAQRGTQATGKTTSGYYTCDRVRMALSNLGTWTLDQASDGPPGFTKSFKATCTTADASPAAADLAYVQFRLEAQDFQHLNFGTSDAVAMSLSFWVKSNKTGSASFMMYQNDNSVRLFSTSYTINSANTWEYKTISIPADTSGLINDDNGTGLTMAFWLNSGSDSTGGSYNTTWGTYADANTNVNNLGVGGSANDNYAITGVQLEVGSVATPFEHRKYGDELQTCKRYYQTVGGVFSGETEGADRFTINAEFKPEMRASPTCTVFTGRSAKIRYAGGDVSITTPTLNNTSTTIAGVWTRLTTSGRTNAKLVTGRGTGGVDAQFIQVDAEL